MNVEDVVLVNSADENAVDEVLVIAKLELLEVGAAGVGTVVIELVEVEVFVAGRVDEIIVVMVFEEEDLGSIEDEVMTADVDKGLGFDVVFEDKDDIDVDDERGLEAEVEDLLVVKLELVVSEEEVFVTGTRPTRPLTVLLLLTGDSTSGCRPAGATTTLPATAVGAATPALEEIVEELVDRAPAATGVSATRPA